MKSETSFVAQQVRLSEWAEQIRECQNRPQGMKVEEWCAQQGITKANYYWRLRRVREAFLETNGLSPSFAEIPKQSLQAENPASAMKIIAVLKGSNHLSLEITDQASPAFLNSVLEALHNAQ